MAEYKITKQTVQSEWAAVEGAPAREMDLYPPSGEGWLLHSCEHGSEQVVAVWTREKRPHQMSEIYSHPEGNATTPASPVKTVADIPVP